LQKDISVFRIVNTNNLVKSIAQTSNFVTSLQTCMTYAVGQYIVIVLLLGRF